MQLAAWGVLKNHGQSAEPQPSLMRGANHQENRNMEDKNTIFPVPHCRFQSSVVSDLSVSASLKHDGSVFHSRSQLKVNIEVTVSTFSGAESQACDKS